MAYVRNRFICHSTSIGVTFREARGLRLAHDCANCGCQALLSSPTLIIEHGYTRLCSTVYTVATPIVTAQRIVVP